MFSTASRPVLAEELSVAVASNFLEPARVLAAAFSRESGQSARLIGGSTGALFAQITHGAPFDVFLAAGDREPEKLTAAGLALSETRFTYAIGSLVLWSADPVRIRGDCEVALKGGALHHIAIANPEIAPYGAAAAAVLRAWGLWDSIAPKLLRAENVGQVMQFVASGNAELGFVAGSQLKGLPKDRAGSYCVVAPNVYPPLRQEAVLLRHGEHNSAARQFLAFLQGKNGLAIIRGFGYRAGVP